MYCSKSFSLSTYRKDCRFQSLGRRAIEARGKNENVSVVLSVRDSALGHALPSQKTTTLKKSGLSESLLAQHWTQRVFSIILYHARIITFSRTLAA